MYFYELFYPTHTAIHYVTATDFMATALCQDFARAYGVPCVCVNVLTGEVIAMSKGA